VKVIGKVTYHSSEQWRNPSKTEFLLPTLGPEAHFLLAGAPPESGANLVALSIAMGLAASPSVVVVKVNPSILIGLPEASVAYRPV
jgi:hypothetical protein